MIQLFHHTVGGVFSDAVDLPKLTWLGYHLLLKKKKTLCENAKAGANICATAKHSWANVSSDICCIKWLFGDC